MFYLEKNPGSFKKSCIFMGLIAGLCLTGCIPDPNLPPPVQKAPPVTGPIEEFFPTASYPLTNTSVPKVVPLKTAEPALSKVPPIGDIKVALLLPLTGSTASIAKDMQDAAMLAVYDSTSRIQGGYTITLLPKDTADSPSVAANVAAQAVQEGAKIIVGPLYAQSVDTVKRAVGNIPVIALSNNAEVKGERCFVFGVTPESEVTRIAEFGLKAGKLHWASLVPNNDYGLKLEAALSKTISGKGGQMTATDRYIASKNGMNSSVDRLVEKLKAGTVDALFLGDNIENSAYMISLLKEKQIDTSTLMIFGTSQWHNDTSKQQAELSGAYYATTNQRAFERFARRFRATNKHEPHGMSAVAYDAVMMVAEIAGRGKIPDRIEFLAKDTMQGPATGAYRFEPDGSVSRGLAVYKLNATGKEMIENAPKQF